jgi:hypothetical protein
MKRLAILVALAGCATATPALRQGWVPERHAVVVPVAQPRAQVFERTVAAFSAEGLAIENADAGAGFVVAAPMAWNAALDATTYALHYRASVIATAGGSDVALSVGVSEASTPLGRVNPAETPGRPANVEPWRRLQRIADRLRTP